MNQYTDQHYIEKSLDGDTRAFSVLVERYQDYVYTIVVRMLRVREEAEEVAQDVFIKAYGSLSSFRGESKFSSWLYSIAYRKALDAIRKNKKHKSSELLVEITEGEVAAVDNALSYLELQERKAKIEECIGRLGEVEAAIVTMYYYESQSVREIAEITQLSEDNVKIKLHRSRKKLFSTLKYYCLPEISNTNGRAI